MPKNSKNPFTIKMMLPEHKQALQDHRKQSTRRIRPTTAEDASESLQRALDEAITTQHMVTVTLWKDFADNKVSGYIIKTDPTNNRIKISSDSSKEWILISDIVSIVVDE